MSASEMARMKRAYPLWSIARVQDGGGYIAERAGHLPVIASTLGELDAALIGRGRDSYGAAGRAAAEALTNELGVPVGWHPCGYEVPAPGGGHTHVSSPLAVRSALAGARRAAVSAPKREG